MHLGQVIWLFFALIDLFEDTGALRIISGEFAVIGF